MPSDLPEKETLPHLIRRALAQPRAEVLLERSGTAWSATSSEQLIERMENVACAIRDAGLSAGDRVALVAHNCVDWIVTDFATLSAGCVVVPIYPTQALDHTKYILEHSEAKLIFVDNVTTLEHLRESGAALPRCAVFDSSGPESLAAFEAAGALVRAAHPELPAAYEAAMHADDLAVLIYTSGTTGNPKGVMLSHDNLTFDSQASLAAGLDIIPPNSDVLSVLPFSHIYEHTIIYIYLLANTRYSICHDPNELIGDLRDVRPVVMTSVPRIFDRVLAGVRGAAMKAGGMKARMVPWALAAGREYMKAKVMGSGPGPMLSLHYALANRLVLKKVREQLGLDRMLFLCSGSAALHIDVAMTFLGIGVPILQGYGLTETSPVTTTSQLTANTWGAVGKPISGAAVKIAEDGEILISGRQVMQGYYRDPAATAEVIQNGWLHTGDIGEVDSNGYLRITDRKREVFKTDTGKWIAPSRIEAAIKRSPYVGTAMVVGANRPHPAALIVPNWDMLRMELALPKEATPQELVLRDDVQLFVSNEVRRKTADLASYEQIRRVILLPREFTVETGELSPAMKIKRRVVEDRYAGEIERGYAVDLHTAAHA
ncbi:MAG TPA: long-chain fatty acid--CoA ligase [Candidatus Acidoferrales bacterium]|nr:long-chain fatty acid--CoA ligase [Candidatus Acidoferrales bacterium]